MRSRSLLLLSFLFLGACADAPSSSDDGGVHANDAGSFERRLVVVGLASLGLETGRFGDIEVQLRESGDPVADTLVSFRLEGAANDSSLSALEARTDADGVARIRLLAGSTTAVFRVRISAEGAQSVFVNATVGAGGLGELEVLWRYEGMRGEPGMQRVIRLYSGRSCDALVGRADREFNLPPGATSWRWALPTELAYAVEGTLGWPDAGRIALDCVDSNALSRAEITRVELELRDVPLEVAGVYSMDVTFDAREVLKEGRTALVGGMREGIDVGDVYLNALDATLRAAGSVEAANRLSAERLRLSMGERLVTAYGGAHVDSLDAAVSELQLAAEVLEVGGRTVVASTDGTPFATWVSERVRLGEYPLELAPSGRVSMALNPDETALDPLRASFEVGLGELFHAGLDARALALTDASFATTLRREVGCEPLESLVASYPYLREACDEVCVAASCDAAAVTVLDLLTSSFDRLDERFSALVLEAAVEVEAAERYRHVESFARSGLDAYWSSDPEAEEGMALPAAVEAERIDED